MSELKISDLRTRIKILKFTEVSPDTGLGPEIDWSVALEIYAQPLKQRVTPTHTLDDGDAIVITQGFNIRPNDVNKGDRLIYQNETYDILDVDKGNPSYYIITSKRLVS